MENRDFVLPEDIKFLAHAILDHRISISYESASNESRPCTYCIEGISETPNASADFYCQSSLPFRLHGCFHQSAGYGKPGYSETYP